MNSMSNVPGDNPDNSLPIGLLQRFREYAYERYGIHFHDAKIDILKMKLQKMSSLHGFSLPGFYSLLATGDPDAGELFLGEIAVGHTFFFRESDHFTHLVTDITNRSLQHPVVWCAASSSGEEPYSIVISLLEAGIHSFKVLASDVKPEALAAIHRGRYHVNQLQNVDASLQKRYFTRLDEYTFAVRPELRKYLAIKRLNLHESFFFETPFDYVFCRNVMIYFDERGRNRVLHTLVDNLAPKGVLYVGHSEALLTTTPNIRKEGPASYRRVG